MFSFGSSDVLTLGKTKLQYELVDTPALRRVGLSGRDSLPADSAMLFNFGTNGKHCIWMKDMRFPLDIIWLNDQQQIVYVKENVSPDTYPEQFCPEADSHYVIEINAGEYSKTGAQLGGPVTF